MTAIARKINIPLATLWTAVVLIMLQIMDGGLTYLNISVLGLGTEMEGNPILRYCMQYFGIEISLIVAKGMAIACIAFITSIASKIKWISTAMRALSLFYTFFAIIPWIVIFTLNT